MLSNTDTGKRAVPREKTIARVSAVQGATSISPNSLPREILRQILCNINSKVLFRLKYVCFEWNIIIKELLEIQQVNIDYARESNALAIFEEFNDVSGESPAFSSFTVYRSRYRLKNLINDNVIRTLLRTDGDVDEYVRGAFLGIMEECAGDVNYLSNPDEDHDFEKDKEHVREQAWKAVLAITGLNYPIQKLRKRSLDSSFGKAMVKKYRSYSFDSDDLKSDNCMITLYPDKRTFSVLIYPATNDWDKYWE